MTSSSKKIKERKRIYNDRTVDGPELVDVNTDPHVRRKMDAINEILKKCPFPEELLKKNK